MSTASILALLLPCQVVQVPQVPWSRAVYHIHSPERFLAAHGLAPGGARVTETFKPVAHGRDNLVAFTLWTEEGRMSGRMLSQEARSSQLVLLDEEDRMCLLARLSVEETAGGDGALIRVSADMARTVGGWDPVEALHSASAARVRAAILAGVEGAWEDPNLLRYRRRVLRPPCGTI
jgi:hypothetical protein